MKNGSENDHFCKSKGRVRFFKNDPFLCWFSSHSDVHFMKMKSKMSQKWPKNGYCEQPYSLDGMNIRFTQTCCKTHLTSQSGGRAADVVCLIHCHPLLLLFGSFFCLEIAASHWCRTHSKGAKWCALLVSTMPSTTPTTWWWECVPKSVARAKPWVVALAQPSSWESQSCSFWAKPGWNITTCEIITDVRNWPVADSHAEMRIDVQGMNGWSLVFSSQCR